MHARVGKKILLGAIAMLLVLITVFATPMSIVAASITEESSSVSYEKTNVLDDLRQCTINGKPFNIADFPYDESKDIQVISFVEYCYSYKANQRDNYGFNIGMYAVKYKLEEESIKAMENKKACKQKDAYKRNI